MHPVHPAHLVILGQMERHILAAVAAPAGDGYLAPTDDAHRKDAYCQGDKRHNDLPGMARTEAAVTGIIDTKLGANCLDVAGLLIP